MADHSSRSGQQRYADGAIVDYVDRVHSACTDAQQRAFDAPGLYGMPAIQVGHSEGRLLTLLTRLVNARRVVEIGTLAGYSALRIAEGMAPDGTIWTIESDPAHAETARERIREANVSQRIQVIVGDALEVLPTLEREGPFDVVFLDADKGGYPRYGSWAQRHLRSGGLLLADNAYLFGELLHDHDTARAMRAFHEETARDFDSVCAPTPDGLVIAVRR